MEKFEKGLFYSAFILLIILTISYLAVNIFFGNQPQKIDNQHFIKKIDSLENQIQRYEQRAEQERQYRNHLYQERDSLENVIVLYNTYLPSIEELKRTRDRQKP